MDYLKEAKDNWEDAKEFCKEQYSRIEEDFEFSNPSDPKQWAEEALNARKGRPTHTLDRTNQYVQHVVNRNREAKTSCDVLPADSNADPEVAKKIKGIIRHIEYTSKADLAWDTASDHQVRGGLGWVRVVPRIVDPERNEQEIIIQRVHDPLSCVLDPNSTEPDGSDAMFGFVETNLTNTYFERRYPNAKKESFDTEGWFSDDSVRICEYFRVVETEIPMISVRSGEGNFTLSQEEYSSYEATTGVKPPEGTPFKAKKRSVKWCTLTGAEILDETEYPSNWIGLVPMLGHEIWIKGKRFYCGLVRRLMDGQRLHNYEMSALTESLMIQPKAPFMIPGRAIEGYEAEWAGLNKGNPAFLPYNDIDESGQPVAPPNRLVPPQFPIAYANTSQLAIQEMENSIGLPKASLGMPSQAISGRAKLADTSQGETATFHFADNRRICQEQVYRIVVDMIPQIYDSRRQAKIMGEDGQQSTILIDPELKTASDTQGGKVVAINPGVGRYDVRVKVGPSYTTIREEMGVKLQELGKGNPILAAALTPILLKLSDMPEADRLERIAMAILPPEVQKAYQEDNSSIPPQAQVQISQQGQQITQMAQAMEQATQVIQDLQGQLNDKNDKVQSEAKAAIAEITVAQTQLKQQSDAIQQQRQLLMKEDQLVQKNAELATQQIENEKLQLQLFGVEQTKKVAEDSANKIGENVQSTVKESTMSLYKTIEEGMMILAEATKKNAQAIDSLQKVVSQDDPQMKSVSDTQAKTLETLSTLIKMVQADRERIPEKDPKTGAITKVVDRIVMPKE